MSLSKLELPISFELNMKEQMSYNNRQEIIQVWVGYQNFGLSEIQAKNTITGEEPCRGGDNKNSQLQVSRRQAKQAAMQKRRVFRFVSYWDYISCPNSSLHLLLCYLSNPVEQLLSSSNYLRSFDSTTATLVQLLPVMHMHIKRDTR